MSPQGLAHSFIILICSISFIPLATPASTASTPTKDTGTNSTSQAMTTSTTTTTTKATTTPTTLPASTPTSPTTTLAPAYLGDDCSSVPNGEHWCNSSISGTAVCDGGTCACGSGFFRKDNSTCLAGTVLTPENLTFPVITSTSLEVRWQMAESLTWKFDVACTGADVTKTEPQLDNMVANFTGLTPGDEYSVNVTASFTNDENTVHSGTKTETQAIDPAKPGNVIQSNYTAPEIELQWDPSGGFVDIYTVLYNGISYNTTNSNTKVTLNSLTAGKTYDITITAISHNRESEERRDTFTTKVEPPSSPTSFGFFDLTNYSVILQWAPPAHPNGNLTGYIVCYDEKVYSDMIDLTRSLCLGAGNGVSYLVEALKPGAFYNFTVYATNTEYNSTAPAELRDTVQTKEAAPGKVTDLYVQALNLSLVVTWKRPEEPNGNIIQYRIDWSSVNIDCTDCLNTDVNQTCPPAGSANCSKISDTIIAVNKRDMDYTISGLEPFTNYTVSVTPYTSAGPGTSDSTTTKTSVVKPGPVRNVTATVVNSIAITVHWIKPAVDPGPVNYTVRAKDMVLGQQISQGCAVEAYSQGFETVSCTVSGLEEYWVYQFVVIASTTAGDSDETRSGNYTTLEGIPGKVQNINHALFNSPANCDATKVFIEWSEPDLRDRNSLIRLYRIGDSHQNSNDLDHNVDHPEPYRQSARRFHVTLSGLNAEQRYIKKIQAVTQGSRLGVERQFNFATESCAPPDWPSNANISEKSGKRTTSSFTVTMQTSFFVNNEQGMVKERGLIVSKTNKSLTLPELLSAKATIWSTSKRNSFEDPYAIKIGPPATSSIDIIVGENAKCEIQANTMCNGQLPPSQQFYVLAYACTSNNKCSRSSFFGAYGTAALPPAESSSNAPVIAGVLVAVGLVIIIVTLVILQLRGVIDIPKLWRKDGSDRKLTEIDGPIQTKRPMRLSQFDDYLMELHKDTNLLFSSQYEDIGKLSKQIYEEQTTEAANLEDNKAKNRWVNILPFDHSRVKLQQLDDDDPTSDYINANYIPGLKHKREYIATQGPLPGTIDDFWRMVWEHNVSIIVMLTQCKEGNRVKCENYWPTEVHEAKQYGDVVVNPVSVSTLNKYNITIFEVSVNSVKRTVHHFHYIEFPDMSAIVEYDIFLEFMQVVRGHYPRTMESPIVVHCSAGVGRTGTFIVLDMLSQLLNRPDFNWDMKVDIFDMVVGMRNHRTNMIQTESQYVMIHDCLSAMLEMKKRATEEQNENLYVNQSYDPYPEVLYENLKGNEMKTDL